MFETWLIVIFIFTSFSLSHSSCDHLPNILATTLTFSSWICLWILRFLGFGWRGGGHTGKLWIENLGLLHLVCGTLRPIILQSSRFELGTTFGRGDREGVRELRGWTYHRLGHLLPVTLQAESRAIVILDQVEISPGLLDCSLLPFGRLQIFRYIGGCLVGWLLLKIHIGIHEETYGIRWLPAGVLWRRLGVTSWILLLAWIF